MMYKYGEYSDNQIRVNKEYIRKRIFFLLLMVDPKTKAQYETYDVNVSFESLLAELGGMNDLLLEPPSLVRAMSLLKSAQKEYNSLNFEFSRYRKRVLDAGSEIEKIQEV